MRDINDQKCFKKGKLYITYCKGRKLWGESYIGPEEYAGEGEEFWKVHRLWHIKRGDGQIFSKSWLRICLGYTWIQFRFFPFIFKISRYNRKYDFHLRWN